MLASKCAESFVTLNAPRPLFIRNPDCSFTRRGSNPVGLVLKDLHQPVPTCVWLARKIFRVIASVRFVTVVEGFPDSQSKNCLLAFNLRNRRPGLHLR